MPVETLMAADEAERALWVRVINRTVELDGIRAKNQAVLIANAVGQLFKRRT